MKRAALLATVTLLALAPFRSSAQQPTPSPSPSGLELKRAPMPPVTTGTVTATAPGPRPSLGTSADAGALKELRAVSVGSGEARVSLRGAARTLRPGGVIEGDVVKAIGDGRIVRARPEPGGGESTVGVAFDAQGRASVRVIGLRDRTAPPAVAK